MTVRPPRLATPNDADELVASLSSASRLGIDTEFHAERRFLPELYLVQIQVEGGPTWIVDPLQSDLVAKIARPMLERQWVVHAGEQDLRVLDAALGGLPDVVLDTQLAAGLVSTHWPAAYATLVDTYVGVSLDKGETLSDWSRRPLSQAQLTYAALDVQHLFPLWDALQGRLAALDRVEVARAACEDARRAAQEPPDDADAFRALPVNTNLPASQLLVLQELAAWRMERARATNQPVRSVLADGVLLDLARRQPLTAASMLANRRLPRTLARDADELVERINRARGRPEWAVPPMVRRRTPPWRAAAWLQLWGEVLGEERSFAASLVLPRPIVEAVVLEPEGGTDPGVRRRRIAEVLGWRDPLCGDDLAAVFRGDSALRFAPPDVKREA